jgi:hypothetical protein
MKEKTDNVKLADKQAGDDKKTSFYRYTLYPANEDIYNRSQKKSDIDPEDISRNKVLNENDITVTNEKDLKEDISGSDLDIPGSELDDKEEKIGSEDEENNYYSLGGDDHNNLEEDKGE